MAKAVAEELFENEEVQENLVYEPSVHTMLRNIATTAVPVGGAKMIEEVDRDISSWVERGYRLVNTHYIGSEPNAIVMLYVLSK